jgi:hypothetical protein
MLAFELVDGAQAREAVFRSVRGRLFGAGSTPARCGVRCVLFGGRCDRDLPM